MSAKQCDWQSHARPVPFPFPLFLFPDFIFVGIFSSKLTFRFPLLLPIPTWQTFSEGNPYLGGSVIMVLEITLSCVRYETGGTLMSAMVSLTRGLSCSTGGGTHHAGPDYGSG